MSKRRGASLLELLVAVSILAVLLALLAPAIQRVRETALRSKSTNNLRQIVLATHHFASAYDQRLPLLVGNSHTPNYAGNSGTLFYAILPFTDLGATFQSGTWRRDYVPFRVPFYLSPADWSAESIEHAFSSGPVGSGLCSYAANAQVFREGPRMPASMPDGSSSTIAFAEHYSVCKSLFAYWTTDIFPTKSLGVHRATFADRSGYSFPNYEPLPGHDDVYPVKLSEMPPISTGSVRGKTFQVAPSLQECDGTVAQTPHTGGMLVALADGAVRSLKGNIAVETYWALVTPAAGEFVGNDW
jgi:prepilin-type N-terminal cleavage/methylation domain-containing protein